MAIIGFNEFGNKFDLIVNHFFFLKKKKTWIVTRCLFSKSLTEKPRCIHSAQRFIQTAMPSYITMLHTWHHHVSTGFITLSINGCIK